MKSLPIKSLRQVLSRQMDLGIARVPELDRNFHKGGRSFYFFDFDDNVAFLTTPVGVFHRASGQEILLSSRQWAEVHPQLGQQGPWEDYEIRLCDQTGSFRYFRDRQMGLVERLLSKPQFFVQDVFNALGGQSENWQGPSWSCFYHAVYNRRPVSVITARGHHPTTLRRGIRLMVNRGFLPHEPNYLSLLPVSHPKIRTQLCPENPHSVPELKKAAIRSSVETALTQYGESPHHRFGMSDDDPKNVELIVEAMVELKRDHPEMSFFVISTHNGQFLKREVFVDRTDDKLLPGSEQLKLF